MTDTPLVVPKSVYHRSLNATAQYHAFAPIAQRRAQLAPILQGVGEALVISPHVTFDVTNNVTDANLPLALLIDYFGTATVRELLREGAIRFLCRTSAVQLSTEGSGSLHPLGLEAETLAGVADRDGERLALAALRSSSSPVSSPTLEAEASQIADLARLAAAATEFSREETAEEAVNLATIALEQAPFWFQGRSLSDFPSDQIPDSHRQWALQLAHDILTASVLREYELDFFEEEASWRSLINVLDSVRSSEVVVTATEKVYALERVLSVRGLLGRGIIQPSEILRIRQAQATHEFRRWLWTRPDPSDRQEILAAYREVLLHGHASVEETSWFRAVKVTVMELIGTVVEAVVKGAAESVGASGPASDAAGRAARGTVAYVGEEFLARMARPANPREFVDELRRLEIGRTALQASGPRLYQ